MNGHPLTSTLLQGHTRSYKQSYLFIKSLNKIVDVCSSIGVYVGQFAIRKKLNDVP